MNAKRDDIDGTTEKEWTQKYFQINYRETLRE